MNRPSSNGHALNRIEIGASVHCTDAPFGTLSDVVIDPSTRRVTHLVVEPSHRHSLARLVPIELVSLDNPGPTVRLRCTKEELGRLELVHENAYVRLADPPMDDPVWDVGVEDVVAFPYLGEGDLTSDLALTSGYTDPHISIAYDRIPKGEVEIRRRSTVMSADGYDIGYVDGVLIDGDHVTHVVLAHGHLWGRREVRVPIGSVDRIQTDLVSLRLSKDAVGALPAVHGHR